MWLHTNKEWKQIPLAIIYQIQTIVTHLVLAASDEDNYPNLDNLEEIKPFSDNGDSNLAMAKRLITYFELVLVKVIQQKKLNGFEKVTPISKKEYPDVLPPAATGGVSLQKSAAVTQK